MKSLFSNTTEERVMDREDLVTGTSAGPGKLLSRTVVVTSFTSTKIKTHLRCPQKRVTNFAILMNSARPPKLWY